MTATLLVAIPLALLGVVALLGFVGCVFTSTGLPDASPYKAAIEDEGGLIGFWPLTETTGTTASDHSKNSFDGTYTGTVTIGQTPGIIAGDEVNGQQQPCPVFGGGVVNVPFHQELNISPPFSVEAWVLPTPTGAPTLRGVVVSNNKTLGAGFGLFASTENMWLVSLGMSTASGPTSIEVTPPMGGPVIDFSKPTHLVVVYDQNLDCTIFVNMTPIITKNTAASGKYQALQDGSTPLFIGAGAPDQGTSPPQFPFTGRIQGVAIYNTALTTGQIQAHFSKGSGA